ncbi:hypothetical protein AB0L88_36820 [Saccharopolyspora shandongensis]|uniref:hypothetical protein n=1 Tax=Saccharopolyspora shandongensis TaxID=418495 RepID=UPI003440F46F
MAEQLVMSLSAEAFDPGGYRDRPREALQALIDAKLADRHVTVPAQRTQETADLEEPCARAWPESAAAEPPSSGGSDRRLRLPDPAVAIIELTFYCRRVGASGKGARTERAGHCTPGRGPHLASGIGSRWTRM